MITTNKVLSWLRYQKGDINKEKPADLRYKNYDFDVDDFNNKFTICKEPTCGKKILFVRAPNEKTGWTVEVPISRGNIPAEKALDLFTKEVPSHEGFKCHHLDCTKPDKF